MKHFISLSNLNESLAGCVFLAVAFCLSSHYIYCTSPFSPAEFLLKSQQIAFWEFPFMSLVAFPLLLFNTPSLISDILTAMFLGLVLFGLILYGTLCAFLTWMFVFSSSLGTFSSFMSSNMSSAPTLSLLLLRLPYNVNGSKLSSFLFILFSVQLQSFPLCCLPVHWSVPLYHLIYYLFLPVYFEISVIIFFTSVWFFFVFSLCWRFLNSYSVHPMFSWVFEHLYSHSLEPFIG